jgi:hypothetical protein
MSDSWTVEELREHADEQHRELTRLSVDFVHGLGQDDSDDATVYTRILETMKELGLATIALTSNDHMPPMITTEEVDRGPEG